MSSYTLLVAFDSMVHVRIVICDVVVAGVMIAGNTVDYVNSVVEKVAQGDRTGGLELQRR